MTKRLGRGDWIFVRDNGNLRVPPNLVLGVAASVIATTQLAADPTSPVAAPADHADRYMMTQMFPSAITTGGNHRAAFDGFHNKDPRQTVDRERFSRTGSGALSWTCFAAECAKLDVDKHDEPGDSKRYSHGTAQCASYSIARSGFSSARPLSVCR